MADRWHAWQVNDTSGVAAAFGNANVPNTTAYRAFEAGNQLSTASSLMALSSARREQAHENASAIAQQSTSAAAAKQLNSTAAATANRNSQTATANTRHAQQANQASANTTNAVTNSRSKATPPAAKPQSLWGRAWTRVDTLGGQVNSFVWIGTWFAADTVKEAKTGATAVATGVAGGAQVGLKAVANSAVDAVVSTATLGSAESFETFTVSDEDRMDGYGTSYAIGRAANEVLVGAATGGAASALSKGGTAAKTLSYGIRTLDAVTNVKDVAEGVAEVRKEGRLTLSSTLKVAGGLGGIAGDLSDGVNALKKSKANRNVQNVYTDCCFTAGTLILTQQGKKSIETITVGERVWALNHRNNEWELCPVVKTFSHFHEYTQISIVVKGERIDSTWHHPYWVVQGDDLANRPIPDHVPPFAYRTAQPGRWVDAGEVRVGDVLLSVVNH